VRTPAAPTTVRPPPHGPPRRAAPRAPIPPLTALLSQARAPADERKTIELTPPPAPGATPVDLGRTMISAGSATPSSRPRLGEVAKLGEEVAHQFARRIGAVAKGGKNVSHCGKAPACNNDPAEVCACSCDRCRFRRRVLVQVRLEVLGPTPTERNAARTRHGQLVAELHQKGQRVAHCQGPGCRPPPRDRPSEVDPLLAEEHCVCACAACAEMRRLLAKAVGQVADAAVA
jgi:hypothetical protein